MTVICNGGYRTGSTFIYTAVIELFKLAGIEHQTGVYGFDEVPRLNNKINWVVKSHNWIPPDDSRAKTIYTRRSYLDVYASFIKIEQYKKRNINIIENILNEKKRRRAMVNLNCLTLDYEDFFNNERWAINQIIKYLNLDIDDTDREELSDRMNHTKLKEQTDKATPEKTQWASHHISPDPSPGNYIDILDQKTIEGIVRAYREA